ncbi:MAG TPA: hypothetical protein VKR58_00315 [Aquella sp.]|nr:hypothetical protein [Aquella sp.]
MDTSYKLSRLQITGKLDASTPLPVILEIVEAHGVDFENINSREDIQTLLDIINSDQVEIVNPTLTLNDYNKIAVFVNSNVEWKVEDLHQAYLFLKSFRNPDEFRNITPDFVYSPQTPETPNSLNACIVYSACKYFNLPLSLETTEDDMVTILREYLSTPQLIIKSIVDPLDALSIENLLKVKVYIHNVIHPRSKNKIKTISQDVVTNNKHNEPVSVEDSPVQVVPIVPEAYTLGEYQKLEKITRELITYYPLKVAIENYAHKNQDEAVIIAYTHYDVDISKSVNPDKILGMLKDANKCTEEELKYLNTFNSDFNPRFPLNMYTTDKLQKLLLTCGYPNDEISDLDASQLYELLQIIYLTDTFYEGILEPCTQSETLIDLIPIKELNNSQAISYGSHNAGFTVYTYTELLNSFKYNDSLVNPITKENFNEISVKKLLYITSLSKFKQESVTEYTSRIELNKLISKLRQISVESALNSVMDLIKRDDTTITKDVVQNMMGLLVHLTMNMRGWDGNQEYPIESSQNLDAVSVDSRISDSIREINLYQANFKEIVDTLLRLPLVKYQNGNYLSSNIENGMTIGEKIMGIQKNKNVNACIRLSSNWLGSTVYKYCKLLGIDPGFEVNKLRHLA